QTYSPKINKNNLMDSNLHFPIVINPIPTKTEVSIKLSIIALLFGPFAYGVLTQQGIYCLSFPIIIFGLFIFNYLTGGKYVPLNPIQKDKSIEFDDFGLIVIDNEMQCSYKWTEIQEIEINLIAYKNKRRDEDSSYDGTENHIKFSYQNIIHKYLFYLETPKEYNYLSDYLEKTVLSKLYELKNIKDESIIISKLNYSELQKFKSKHNINRYTDFIHFN
ncbi:TPA: hypothetical protein ACGFUW_002764, partial [Flavobacterium psychrophilum]